LPAADVWEVSGCEEFRAEDAIVALFRAEADAADHDGVFRRLRECIALGRELTNLEKLLGIARDLAAVAHYPLPAPEKKWDAIQQGRISSYTMSSKSRTTSGSAGRARFTVCKTFA